MTQSPLNVPPTSDLPAESDDFFAPFRTAWSPGGDEARWPTEQFLWWNACALCLADETLDVVVAQRGNQPVALAPLIARGEGIWRSWTMLGEGLYEPSDLIYRDLDALERVALALLRRGQAVHFDRLPLDKPTIEVFQRLSPGRALLRCRPAHSAPFIPLDATWLEPESHLSAKRRSDLRRARRHAEKIGPVTAQILTPSTSEVDRLMDDALSIEARSWKGEMKTALLYDRRCCAFFRRYARAASAAGLLRLCFLRIGEQAIAMQIAQQSAGAFWLLTIGYNEAFARCSPGLLLMHATIRRAVEAGLQRYEFLGDEEPWTQVWTQHAHRCVKLDVYPFTPRGMAVLARATAGTLKRKWKRTQ
ncbi:MAG TPA: GNAT family N-acetyltransferase [Verrucomicrobiae bacterium]|nr:GNAT family N-acetyltransferase [Verrucomicrobiae bacterium]